MFQASLGDNLFAVDPNGYEIAIPLLPNGEQPNHFGAEAASSEPLTCGAFTGDTRSGGSCNCETLTLTPHCNGTHTECVGHVTDERFGLAQIPTGLVGIAALVSIAPIAARECDDARSPYTSDDDRLISSGALHDALRDTWRPGMSSVVLRTMPNTRAKRMTRYDPDRPCPYLTAAAAALLVELDVQHLLVDVPSIDRLLDGGLLLAHRIFWGLPRGSRALTLAKRRHATVTEMIYVPDEVADGRYFLNLQVPRLASDAAPSRPSLHPLRPL
jgi:kynurenine formamidase